MTPLTARLPRSGRLSPQVRRLPWQRGPRPGSRDRSDRDQAPGGQV